MSITQQAQDAASKLADTVASSLSLGGQSSTLPTLYIDEKAGSDTEGTGAELSPFATPLAAYQSLKPAPTSDANPTSVANFL
ncbi:hypothetical protein B9479_001507, partial [Cryptococcus floricola]